jgi:hypothetical protein
LIQVFKAIHKHIITYWFACFKATDNFSGHDVAPARRRGCRASSSSAVASGDSRKARLYSICR